MKKIPTILLSILLLAGFLSENNKAQENQKLAQTGFKFLSVVSDARGAAMGEAMTSLQMGSSALFFNPAGMADMTTFCDVSGSINTWIADINHTAFSVALNPFNGDYGVFGFSVQLVDYGDFYGTVVNPASPQGYDDTGIFNLNALALGFGYARKVSDRFSIGGQIKWIRQDLGESIIPVNIRVSSTDEDVRIADTATTSNKLSPLVFDFGTQFRTGIKSLVFGMSVRNFSKEVEYVDEGIQAPMVFTLGVSMDVMDLFEDLPFKQSLYVSLDASHYRDHPEQIKIGLDYKIMDMLALRAGYMSSNDQNDLTYGIGINKYGFSFDYSYTPFGVFNNVQRFTFRFAL
ncbi:MAG: PorV/PorQ family protein [bacterium]